MRLAGTIISAIAILASSAVFASDNNNEKIRALMEAQGLLDTFSQQIASGKVRSRQIADNTIKQIFSGLPVPPEFELKVTAAASEFIDAMQPTWGAQDIVDVLAKYYGSNFTDDELDQLVAFYTSPLGKKDVLVSRQAVGELGKEFGARYQRIAEQATAMYTERLKQVVKELSAAKKN